MSQMFANAARGELLYGIGAADTAFTLDGAAGGAFPVANRGTSSSGTWFRAVLVHADKSNYEIVRVRTHASGSSTFSNVLRAQEGTTAQSFAAGAVVGLRPTAEDAAGWTLPEGGTSDYHLDGGRAWTNTAEKVRGTPLTGLSTDSGADVVATDSILAAIGKLARKILDHFGVGGGAHPLATTSVHGFFASAEKVKLSGIAENAAALGDVVALDLGTASAGSATTASRSDHVHKLPTAAELGAAPSAHVGAGGTAHANATTSVDGFMSSADKTKLNGIASNATANASNAELRDRSTHTGTQAQSTVTNLTTDLAGKASAVVVDGSANTFNLASAGNAVPITANSTIPTNASVAYPVGTCIMLQCGSTSRTISGPGANTLTLEGSATTVSSVTLKANKSVVIRKTATDAWRVYGDV